MVKNVLEAAKRDLAKPVSKKGPVTPAMIFIFVIGMPVLMRFVYPFPVLFRRLSTVFFIDSETNEAIPLHFRNVFHFFSEKNSLSKTFLVECAAKRAASCNERREFWRQTLTPLWLLIGF